MTDKEQQIRRLSRALNSLTRQVDGWEKEGEVIDQLPTGKEKKLSMIRMQMAAGDHKVLWFQGHVYRNSYKAIGAAIDVAKEIAKH